VRYPKPRGTVYNGGIRGAYVRKRSYLRKLPNTKGGKEACRGEGHKKERRGDAVAIRIGVVNNRTGNWNRVGRKNWKLRRRKVNASGYEIKI